MSFSPSSSVLPPSSPSKYLAVHLLIILSRLLEEQRRGGLGSNSVAPFDGGEEGKEQSGEEFETGRAVVKRLHNALAKEFCPSFLCKQFFFL